MSVYTVAMSKGGTTKTTTAAELVAELARRGRRVLAIDLDQQGNLSTRLGVTDDTEVDAVAADVLAANVPAAKAAIEAPGLLGASILIGTHDLADLDTQPEILTALRDDREELLGEWDDVVIDTPPALSLLTLAGLAAADTVVAALECKTEGYDQLRRLTETIAARVAPRLRKDQQVNWIVPSRYDSRRSLDREILELLREEYPGRVTPPIREAIAAADAYTAGQPVSVYAPGAGITQDYAAALELVLTRDLTTAEEN